MKKITSLIGIAMLLCCLFAVKAQASIIPADPNYWDYFITLTPDGSGGFSGVPLQNKYGYDPLTWSGDTIIVDNQYVPTWVKTLAVELTYSVPTVLAEPIVTGKNNFPNNGGLDSAVTLISSTITPLDLTYYWKIVPQCDWETITLPPGWSTDLLKIDIATICVPEPSTVFAGLSALGMLGLLSWRNRK